MQRKVNVVKDLDGNKIVFIHDVRFKGKRSIEWTDVETYLKEFVGESYVIEDTNDMIYIGADFPDEYAHSEYTTSLKGANAKAKSNAAQGVPELIEIATGKEYRKNTKTKHSKDAKFGWYRYTSRFALPVYKESGEVERYNVFNVIMVVRHAQDGKLYLYDLVNIKKKRATFSSRETLLSKKPISFLGPSYEIKKDKSRRKLYNTECIRC